MNSIFNGLFDTQATSIISLTDFLICIVGSLAAGLIIALVYMYKNEHTKSFIVTLAMLPAIVCVVIMMVNGNVGAGVATAGAFSLVRFRSIPGTAKEIGIIFLAMGTGLIMGMGYIAFGFVFVVVMCAVFLLYTHLELGEKKQGELTRTLRVTIPEDLDYTDIFDDIFEKYTDKKELVSVKTTNMGSLFKLTYNLTLKDSSLEKAMIDDMRCRNGNLEIAASRQEAHAPIEL